MKRSQLRVLHPFFLAIYPVIFLFSHNMVELSLFEQRSVLRIGVPAVCILGLTWLLLFVVNLAYNDHQRAGIVVSMLLFLFFLYGHIHHAIVNNLGKGFVFAIGPLAVKDHVFYYGTSLLIVLLVLYLLRNPQRHLAHLTRFLNVVSCVLVALAVGNILFHEFLRPRDGDRYRFHLWQPLDRFLEHKRR